MKYPVAVCFWIVTILYTAAFIVVPESESFVKNVLAGWSLACLWLISIVATIGFDGIEKILDWIDNHW